MVVYHVPPTLTLTRDLLPLSIFTEPSIQGSALSLKHRKENEFKSNVKGLHLFRRQTERGRVDIGRPLTNRKEEG